MKRNEIKKEFGNQFNNIVVSEQLKEDTLKRISASKSTIVRPPYWLKNCAAILIVTFICLSIYLTRNNFFSKCPYSVSDTGDALITKTEENIENNITTSGISEDISSNSIQENAPNASKEIKATRSLQKRILTEDNSLEDSIINEEPTELYVVPLMMALPPINSNIIVGDTLETLLINYPNAKKTEEGYFVEDENMLYVLESNIIIEIKNAD